jgi:alpha-amylase/alpha-mannosidase (GH57 family)
MDAPPTPPAESPTPTAPQPRYVCIHGHFYQPPRENPWLEAVELQESAYPYHDWNARITAECYAANAKSRVLDGEGRIVRIVNNYERISFNFGPTLLSWLEEKEPELYQSLLEANRRSAERFGGHGSAMAQAYNHMILPLSNDHDRRTQVLWGIRDFEHRFGRKPEGMWCPETAVNTPTLETLAEHGIVFTVLAPRQAARVRKLGGRGKWKEVHGGIDPSRAYLCKLPSGREISLFFYDGPVSQGVAFEHLLESGEKFAARLMDIFDDHRDWPQLAHIATDGETYGHHHRHGDMALAYALDQIERGGAATLTNYGQFLERHPPTHEVQIVENSSWSCVHGVERWKSNCGCNSGRPGWNQEWRAPLREALDWLRDTLGARFDATDGGRRFLKDPWAARDAYIGVMLDRSGENIERFLAEHCHDNLDHSLRRAGLKLLEMERHLMLMYTSCGWFFDELSGIETVQVTQYAARAIQLAREVLGEDLEPGFLDRLERAPSNIAELTNGRRIYEDFVRPAVVDLHKVAAHYAVDSLFDEYPDTAQVYAFTVQRHDASVLTAGRTRLLIGRATFTSRITLDREELTYGVLHLGDHVLNAGVCPFQNEEAYNSLRAAVGDAFNRADYTDVLQRMSEAFGGINYTLRSLFKDEQRHVVEHILSATLDQVQATYRQIYEANVPLLRFLAGLGIPPPAALRQNAELVLNDALRRALLPDEPDLERIRAIQREAREQSIAFDPVTLSFAVERALARAADRLGAAPRDEKNVRRLAELATLSIDMPFEVSLWDAQNVYYDLLHSVLPEVRRENKPENEAWTSAFLDLGRRLHVKVD